MAKDKTVQTVTPAPQVARRPVPAEEPRKKADVILEKIDCLLGTTNAIVGSVDRASSNTSYLSRQSSEIFERTLEENASLRQQIKYIAQQSQNVYDKVSEAISSLTKKIDDLQTSLDNQKPAYTVDDIVAAVMERINSGELADAVASRIDYDAINDGVEEVFADYFAAEEIEDAPAETVTTSAVTDVTVDTDEIARKVADLVSEVPVQEVISADIVAAKVAEQLASGVSGVDAEQLANYVIDKIREDGLYGVASSGDINYEKLSNQIAQKINIEVSSASGIDYDRLASLVAYKISPESVEDEQIAEMFAVEEDEESIYADLKAEEAAEKPVEKRPAEYTDERYEAEYEEHGYDETTMEEFDYEYLAELIAARMTEPENMKIIADRVAENLSVEDEVDVEQLADVVASRISGESVPAAESAPVSVTETSYVPVEVGIDYERFSALVAEKLVEREDIVVDEFFDYEKLADLLAQRVEWPHEEKTTVVETRAESVAAEIDYDIVAEKIAALLPVASAEIDYDLVAGKVASLLPEWSAEVDYDVIADKVAEEIPAPRAVEIDYDIIAEKVAALMPEPAGKEDAEINAEDAAQEIAADIDYELLSDLIAKRISVPSVDIDAEEIATYVSEKIEMPKIPSVTDVVDLAIDYEELSTLLAQKLMDEEYPEENVSETEVEAEYVEEDRAEAEAVNETFQEVDYEILTDVVSTAVRDTMLTIEIDYERIAKDIVDYINELDEAPFDDGADLPDEEDAVETTGEGVDYARIGRIVQRGINRGLESNKNCEELSGMVARKVVEAIDEMDAEGEELDEELDFDFVDYGKVGDIVREVVTQIYEENRAEPASVEIPENVKLAEEDIDAVAELVAQNVAEMMPGDYDMQVDEAGCEAIAKAVYERIDKEELAKTIADYLSPAKDEIVERVIAVVTEEETPAPEMDYDAVAEKIAERIAAESEPATFEIDYDVVADKVAEKIPVVEASAPAEMDYDEVAKRVAEKISFETEVVPVEIDYDVVADKVAERIPSGTETAFVEIDYDAVADKVAERISVKRETEIEYKTEIDEESIDKISDIVLEEVKKYIDESGRLERKVDVVDDTTKEIRDMLERGIVLIDDDNAEIYNGQETKRVVRETVEEEPAPAEEASEEEEITEEQATEELMSDASAETAEAVPEQPVDDYVEDEEGLITISDIIGDIVIDEENEETTKEPVEDVVIIIDQNVPKVRQHAAKRDENAPAVDFGNMMRYNRSFISRIIQGTDEVKTFYGRIKTGFLAYRKVNSTLSWGGERFNKGRETVARLKIRGKTLVLYLALNPQEFKETVYHQVDASDIKSVANTPMMVKVKSPLGAKKAIRLIDNLMARRHGIKQNVRDRDYVAMYPYETTEELIEEELIKTTTKPGKGDEE